jgi:adenosylcobinamide kinase/adenosylcobinamide-phosphate guanylyltransferase
MENRIDGSINHHNKVSDKLMKEILLVLGGARSGKSSWALKYVERAYRSHIFLATAQVLDREMAERVRLHKGARGPSWELIEEPINVPGILRKGCGGAEAILVDCLTIWLSNVMLGEGEERVGFYQEELLLALQDIPQSSVLVANEVGMGIVPEHPLGRSFRDAAGFLNQKMASIADRVVMVVAGLPMWLKGNGEELEKEEIR